MDSISDSDNYTTLQYNPSTNQQNRLWIRYGDNTFEPVRRDGNLNRKYRSRTRPTDWWVTERPRGWDPAEHGFDVSLNHDFGEQDKPGKPGGRYVDDKLFRRGESVKARTMEYRYGGDAFKPVPFSAEKADNATGAPADRRSTLAQGGEGYRRHEAERQAAKSSTQSAEDLKQWEREQGVDPNQGSGHERRPPSSSKDAAEMEYARSKQGMKDYIQWLRRQKENPAWGKEKTPVEKVRNVTEPLGREVAVSLLQQMLDDTGSKVAQGIGKVFGRANSIIGFLADADEAW